MNDTNFHSYDSLTCDFARYYFLACQSVCHKFVTVEADLRDWIRFVCQLLLICHELTSHWLCFSFICCLDSDTR
jgi:hypothetical protein